MKPLEDLVSKYIEYKKSLGFDFLSQTQMLHSFEVFAYDRPFNLDLALEWSRRGSKHSENYERTRYETIRRFSEFAHALDCDMPALPPGVLGKTRDRVVPYIYSEDDLAVLMRAARVQKSHDGLKSETMPFLIGLMASTGLRISEALTLKDSDVNLEEKLITVTESKNGQTRIIPVADDVAHHIGAYQSVRNALCKQKKPERLAVGTGGTPPSCSSVEDTFAEIRWSLLNRGESFAGRKPRLHDLRHSFAVATIIRWQRANLDVNAMIPYLSVYLGHKKIADTYWYLTGVPELLESVGETFRSMFHGDGND